MLTIFMNAMRLSKFIPIFILLTACFALFWKLFLQGLLPFPGDLLVSFYFPWSGGGFAGFDPWTTRKDVVAMDVIRQMYPWKTLAFDVLKSGQFPFWNPYNFSGSPLFANLQSSILFPGNILFLILPSLWAWIGLVVGLPFLFSVFWYLFFRSLNLSKIACLFGAIIASNISYITVWAEQLVIIQSAIFLPLILLFINKKRFVFVPILLALSVFGGHMQTTIYAYIFVLAYLIYQKTNWRWILGIMFFSILIAAIQLIPSTELYFQSARETFAGKQLFFQSTFPWKNLVTFFAPDFYGNPATKNFSGMDYGNFQGYFGITALILAFFAKNKFFFGVAISALIFSLSPFANIFAFFNIPVLSSGYPSRLVFLTQTAMAILAAMGLNQILKNKQNLKKIFLFFPVFIFLWIVGGSVSRNNLILPTAIFLVTAVVLLLRRFHFLLIVLAILEASYFFNKYQPFAPVKFVFPKHPVFNFLQEKAGINRFYGEDRAYIDNNFATYYRVFGPEGYDPLYIKRYGELISSEVTRSDARFSVGSSQQKEKILDLVGVKYLFDKNDEPKWNWEPDTGKFPEDKYQLVWQHYKWKAFERKTVLPRSFLVSDYIVAENSLDKIFETDLTRTLILEKDPNFLPVFGNGEVIIESYEPNKIVLFVKTSTPQFLFLSDNYYSGWKVFVDGKEKEILRANYTFRAVPVETGNHKIIFSYDPWSFKIGLLISIISLFGWLKLSTRRLRQS